MSDIDFEKLAHDLGPEGPGFAVLPDAYPEGNLVELQDELTNPELVWRQQSDVLAKSGRIKQVFSTFAHKLSQGDQAAIAKMPAFAAVAEFAAAQIASPLESYFPPLKTWEADEITAQKYPGITGELSGHFDLERHPGVIVTLNAVGTGILGVESRLSPHYITEFLMRPGSLFVQRGPGLFNEELLIGARMRQKHSVSTTDPAGRTSVTVRANNRHTEPIKGFFYHNWQS